MFSTKCIEDIIRQKDVRAISRTRFNIVIGLALVLSSISIYFAQVWLFRDARSTFFYLFQDMAFVPLQVFIVTLILERILSAREKRELIRKINVVISAFYSEVGIEAIAVLNSYNNNIKGLCSMLNVDAVWTDERFRAAIRGVRGIEHDISLEGRNLEQLLGFLLSKKSFMLTMFENTNLLEHDSFTDMLWAVFHLTDELQSRDALTQLPQKDMEHLCNDIKRAYHLLVFEWLYYMNHLKKEYPYLFSLAVRKSPFNENASVIIK